MSGKVQAGVLQLVIALGLFYAFWSGALAVLIDGVTTVIRGGPQPGRLFDAVTAGSRQPAAATGAGGGDARLQ